MSRRSEKTKARPPVELVIDGLSHEGRGLSRLDGKRIFVEGALPGEQVLAQYTFTHKKYDEARVVEIRQASPDRVTPPCEHFDICGGNTRVRAQQLTNDPWAEDPGCYLRDDEIGAISGSDVRRIPVVPFSAVEERRKARHA